MILLYCLHKIVEKRFYATQKLINLFLIFLSDVCIVKKLPYCKLINHRLQRDDKKPANNKKKHSFLCNTKHLPISVVAVDAVNFCVKYFIVFTINYAVEFNEIFTPPSSDDLR